MTARPIGPQGRGDCSVQQHQYEADPVGAKQICDLRQQRTAELKQIAGQMLTIIQTLRIHREAIAALVLFQRAIEVERVSFGLMRDLAAYLKNSRHDPCLPFRPSLQ